MIVIPGPLDPPAERLLAVLESHGAPAPVTPDALPAGRDPVTLVVSTGPFVFDFAGLVAALGARPFRVLVLSRSGASDDARTPALRRLARLERHVLGGGAPTLVLRLAPLLGPGTPLWNRLRSRPLLFGAGRRAIQPALERDAVEALARALAGHAPWIGTHELAGPDAWTLAALRALASAAGRGPDRGAWEPPLEEMAEHRPVDATAWGAHFALAPGRVGDALRERAA